MRVMLPIFVLSLLCGGSFGYLETYYHADLPAVQAAAAVGAVHERLLATGDTVVYPDGASIGLVFYPGGKVEEAAYLPLLRALAQRGLFCALCKMPFRLAVFSPHDADAVREAFPEIRSWYICGHSLGGAMAATELSGHPGVYQGLILLAAYSTADLSGMGVRVLSLTGSEDRVLDREKYEKNRKNIAENLKEIEIDGGCHAGFGCYGAQRGDGIPAISGAQQIRLSADLIYQWIVS